MYRHRNDIKDIAGTSCYTGLLATTDVLIEHAREAFEQTGQKQRLSFAADDTALTWGCLHWVMAKAAPRRRGRRHYEQAAQSNRLKERFMLFADRTSAHRWWAHQRCILLSALAYALFNAHPQLCLQGTPMARTQ